MHPRQILTHLGEPLKPRDVSRTRELPSADASRCGSVVLGVSYKHRRMTCP